jgi:protease I
MTETKKVAFLVASEGIEKVELVDPWKAVADAGHTAVLLSPERGTVQLFEHLDKASTQDVDGEVASASVDDFDALVLPGGVANPDLLRADVDAVKFVRAFFDAGKPVAAICHAPWLLIEAGVVEGRTMTSFESIRTDLKNAGAIVVDDEVVVDRGLVTSRKPDDIPAFNAKMIEEFAEGRHEGQAAA